ncbi:inter-alpha-trypsin inhibitor heavy chain H3-like [Crotalus adamanteus]|uniref:Inter-alpha-trypsin inhibitor heavy chain H3-like n=1 Tax=Crotalus adamanteus TaxID=8729 RepID=A0AAW1BWM8_CROAD
MRRAAPPPQPAHPPAHSWPCRSMPWRFCIVIGHLSNSSSRSSRSRSAHLLATLLPHASLHVAHPSSSASTQPRHPTLPDPGLGASMDGPTTWRRIEERSVAQGDEKENITAKALELSLKYKFVTPLTSMVVTKPEGNEEREAVADKPIEAKQQLPSYQPTSAPYYYSSADGDPHFIIAVPQKEDALCFNINEEPGVVINLIRDPVTGITVNGQLIGDKRSINNVRPQITYFGKLGIVTMNQNVRLEITTQNIVLQNGTKRRVFSWLHEVILQQPSLTLIIKQKRSLEISMDNGAKFVIVLHQVWKKHPVLRDFLGFYTVDSHRLSEQTHGLLGQFFHQIDFDILEVHPGLDPERPDATMIVKNNQLTVTRGWQKDYTADVQHGTIIPCWLIQNNGDGLIDGNHTDYIVPSIF